MLFAAVCFDLLIFLGIIIYAVSVPLYYFIYRATGGKRKFIPWLKAMKKGARR